MGVYRTNGRRLQVRVVAGLVGALCVLAPANVGASQGEERTLELTPGVVTPPPPGAEPFRDRILDEPPTGFRGKPRIEQGYTTPDGKTVYIEVSSYYAPNSVADQQLANFLGGLLHNFELDGVRVYVAGPTEIDGICGGPVAACYDPAEGRMFIVGEASYGGYPTDYVIAHEYGHHVAANRQTPLPVFPALDWGTIAWASYNGICPGIASNAYSFSTDGANYYRNPGEAFAEAFAQYHYPGQIAWEWVASLAPGQGDFDNIAFDVNNPWDGFKRSRLSGRIREGAQRNAKIKTPLDGRLKIKLSASGRNTDFDLYLVSGGKVVKKSNGRGSRESVKYLVCGEAKFRAIVDAYRGTGTARLTVLKP